MILEAVDRYRVVEPLFEGVRLILNYRGETYSSEYIQGISGAAFRIAGICSCAPTCSCAMWSDALVRLLGYECTTSQIAENKEDAIRLVHEWMPQVKEDILANRPVLAWHAFTMAEWDVICGFNDESKEFYGRGSYAGMDEYARADQERMASAVDICPAFGIIRVGEKTSDFNAKEAEITALTEAVRHAREIRDEGEQSGQWQMLEGIQCYDRWVRDFRDNPEKKRDLGDSYCIGIYRSTHRAASLFLKEIAPNHSPASHHLLEASKCFSDEADILDECIPLLWFDAPEGPDSDRNAKAAELLAEARDNYAIGIDSIELGLKVIK